jgi:hypothetical protein
VRTLLLMRRCETIALRSSLGSASELFANLNSVAGFPTSSGLGTVQLLMSRITLHVAALMILGIAKCWMRDPQGIAVRQKRGAVEIAPAEFRGGARFLDSQSPTVCIAPNHHRKIIQNKSCSPCNLLLLPGVERCNRRRTHAVATKVVQIGQVFRESHPDMNSGEKQRA